MRVKNFLEKLKYKSLEKLGSNLIITQKLILSDKYGKKLNEQFKVSESLTGNYLQLLYIAFSQTDTTNFVPSNFNGVTNNGSVKLTTGVVSSFYLSSSDKYVDLKISVPANNSSYGILFGTDSTTPTPLDYKANAPISNGGGVGQLNYLAQGAIQAPIAAGSNTSFTLQRIATNTSGGTINVNEVVIYISDSSSSYVCIYRDVANQPVLNTQTLTCQITFQITT